jgi:hypothetical protein
MEWLALGVWILVAAIGLVLTRCAFAAPMLGVQALAGAAGLGLCILFIVHDGGLTLAWGAFAAAIVGLVAVGLGAATLTADTHGIGPAGQRAEERAASLAGVELALYLAATGVALLLALDI